MNLGFEILGLRQARVRARARLRILRWHGSHSAEVNDKHKPGLQPGPGLLPVSRLGFALGQSCFA